MDILALPPEDDKEGQEPEVKEPCSKNQNSDSGFEDTSIEKTTNDTIILTETQTLVKDNEDTEDIIILRRDPTGKRNLINKTAYVKLHRAVSPEKNRVYVESVKGRYENKSDNELDPKLDQQYSPTGFGIPIHNHVSPKLPLPKPRSKVISQIINSSSKVSEKDHLRYSLQIQKPQKDKDENFNEIPRRTSSSSGEFITIVTRSDSEESVDKLEKELDLFTMENKPKKRSNSFRKIFSGKIFGKDKKKNKNEEELPKMAYRENVSNSVNMHKETNSFNRHAAYRHTTGSLGSIPRESRAARHSEQLMNDPYKVKELEDRYARMHVQEFNHIKQNFENQRPKPPPVDYVPMDKPVINTAGPATYAKYIDTSSSNSTELDENSSYQSNSLVNTSRRRDSRGPLIVAYRDKSRDRSRERSRERNTPPRAQDIRQDVKLVNPKALIPINSERALPIPYQNRQISSLEKTKINYKPSPTNMKQNENVRPYFEETYGTVFDSLDKQKASKMEKINSESSIVDLKIPKSPTKLKLPPNREIVPLSPKLTSPIPHDNVSTDKMIATELLKPRSPSPTKKSSRGLSPSHQRLEVGIDYPDNVSNEQYEKNIVTTKPPISRIPAQKNPGSWSPSRQRLSQISTSFDKFPSQSSLPIENHRLSQASPIGNPEKLVTNTRTPTPSSLAAQNRSLSPITITTPVDMRPPSVSSLSPQKEDMRRSVEAFYWREIKKLKEQENMDLYYYQMNMMPSNYHEEPISTRRSRSMSPSSHRNSRRSLSLPRDPKPRLQDAHDGYGGRSIPEGRAMTNQDGVLYQQNQYQQNQFQQNFRRNTQERRTVDNMQQLNGNYSSSSLYRPIFKRGSLTTPIKEVDDFQNKKVSFSNNNAANLNMQAFIKNGVRYNVPQNRMYNENEVYQQQNNPRMYVDRGEIYGYTNRPMNPAMYQQQQQQQQMVMMAPNYPNVQFRPQMQQETYRIVQNSRPQEMMYGQQRVAPRPQFALTRHGSMQLQDRPQVLRKMSYDHQLEQQVAPVPKGHSMPPPRREIIVQDEIFGQFGGYMQHEDPYGYSRQQVDSVYGYSQHPKQISVNNRVCDMYGQIHDGNPGQAKNSGVLLGQIRNSPQVTRHLSQENFQRNTRLTSSANDMYRRYPRTSYIRPSNQFYQQQHQEQEMVVPNRPLPPVPRQSQGENGFRTADNKAESKKNNPKNSKKRFFFGKKNKNALIMETDDTRHLSTSKLRRLVLLEQLHHVRSKRINADRIAETKETRRLKMSELQRLVLLEQLQEIRATTPSGSHAMETEETKRLTTYELELLVLMEQFYVTRIQKRFQTSNKRR